MKRAGLSRGEGEVEVGCSSSGFWGSSGLGKFFKDFQKGNERSWLSLSQHLVTGQGLSPETGYWRKPFSSAQHISVVKQ